MTLDQQLQADWKQLRETGRGFMNSFQTRSLKIREDSDLYMGKFGFGDYGNNGPEIIEINTYFGTKLSDMNRGGGDVYMLLKKEDGMRGTLFSYGAAHRDMVGRLENMHYFIVQGDYSVLQKSMEQFGREPQSIEGFVDTVFEWGNATHRSGVMSHNSSGYIPNIISDMKELYLLEVEKEYSFMDRMRIKFKGNGDVKCVRVD